MYKILLVKDKRDNYESLYQFLTTKNDQNQIVQVELSTDSDLDTYVETMLNTGGYSKNDFIIVTEKTHTVSSDIA